MKPAAFTSIQTPRLRLRQLKISDAPRIALLRSDENVNRYIDRAKSTTEDGAREFINKINNSIANNESYYWAITMQDDDAVIGTICLYNLNLQELKVETGYELFPDQQQKGIMSEALNSVMKFAVDQVKLKKIEAFVHPENDSSLRLLEKCGFARREGVHVDEDGRKNIAYELLT